MCINIANEQLQHFFNEHVFKWEQDECAREGVTTESFGYHSNWPVIELFLGKTSGLLALIDEESRFPRATDHTLAAKMHRAHHRGQEVGSDDVDSDSRVLYRAPPDKGAKFGVNHYAGYVSVCIATCMYTFKVPTSRSFTAIDFQAFDYLDRFHCTPWLC